MTKDIKSDRTGIKRTYKFKKIRGQIQLGETTAVVIIIIILLVLGIVFWNNMSSSNIIQIQSQSHQLQVIEMANSISELTELAQTDMGIKEVKCMDWYKILAMSEVINNPDDDKAFLFYNDYFINSKIDILKIYPEVAAGDINNVTLYDAKLNTKSTSLLIPIPICIYDVVNKKTSFGIINVRGYYDN